MRRTCRLDPGRAPSVTDLLLQKLMLDSAHLMPIKRVPAPKKIQQSPDFSLVRDKGYQFQVMMDNVPCDPSNSFAEMMDIFSHKESHQFVQNAFVGPSCDEVCQPGGRLAKYFDVMMVSYGCESSIFDDKEEYPTFGRTTTTFKDMEVFFAEIIHHFKWPRVKLVTERTPVWQETMTEFEEQISRFGVQVKRWTVDSVSSITEPEFVQESQDTRVFLLLMYPEAVLDFMRQAERANLTTVQSENVFLVVDFAGSHHKMDFKDGAFTFLEGVLDITYDVQPESEGYQNFLGEILNLSQIATNPNCTNYEYGIHPMLVSDGIYVVAGAFNSSLAQNISVTEGAAVANTTHGATFQGLYHTIEMDEKATRRPRFMLHNIQGGCYKSIGRTRPDGTGLVIINSNIVWPGGGNHTPRGSPYCGWDGQFCTSDNNTDIIAVGSVSLLLVIIIMTVIFMWRRNLKTRLLATDWLLDWADIEPRIHYPDAPGYVELGSTRHLSGGSLDSLSTLRSEGSEYLTGAGVGGGGTHSAAPTTTTMSGGMLFRCPVVKMDVEGIWAIKFIRKSSSSLTQSVKRELNLVRGLKHPNVNAFMGACMKPGHMCVMWAYSPKGSLHDLIHSEILKMDLMFQLSFAQDIVKGLAYIHKSELTCHGRVKSTNVVVDAGLTCKLTDVDMPRLRDGGEDLDLEDPDYWFQYVWTAPELLRTGCDVDLQKADIYSYGIVLYEIMLKRKPYVTESNTRVLIEPHWKSVIECVRDPEMLNEILENLRASDNILEVAETEEDDGIMGSVMSGQLSIRESEFPGVQNNVSQSAASLGPNLQDQVQNKSYWSSFRHHYQRNKQTLLSTTCPPSRLMVGSNHRTNHSEPDRAKSTSVVFPKSLVTPARSMSVTPALLNESRRARLYGTSRRSSCDSSLSTLPPENLHPRSEPQFAKIKSSLLAPASVSSNIHQSAASDSGNPVASQTHTALSQNPLSSKPLKTSSPSRQRRKSRISPCPEDDSVSTSQPQTQTQSQNINSHLSGIAEGREPRLVVTNFLTQTQSALDSFSNTTTNTAGSNQSETTQRLHDENNSNEHFNTLNSHLNINQCSTKMETSSSALDGAHKPGRRQTAPDSRCVDQVPREDNTLTMEDTRMDTSRVDPGPPTDTLDQVPGISSPKRTGRRLSDRKLLPIHFPGSPVLASVESTDLQSSCPQTKQPHISSSPPTCCCCPKLKKSSLYSSCKPKNLEKTFALESNIDLNSTEHINKQCHDKPETSEGGCNRQKSELTKSEHNKPEHIKHEHIRFEHIKPEHIKPEHIRSEHIKPEHTRSEHIKSEHIKHEHIKPEHIRSEHIPGERPSCSPGTTSGFLLSPATLLSRPSTWQLHRASNSIPDKSLQLMRPEIPHWHRGPNGRSGSVSTISVGGGHPPQQPVRRGRAMSVDRSKQDLNAPTGEGRASALDFFSRASFYNRRATARGAGTVRRGDKEGQMMELMKQCWAEDPDHRPSADTIIKTMRSLTTGRSLSDNIEKIVSRYSEQLEITVNERTRRLEEEKAKYFRVLCEVIPQ
ncbi:hypothetical protein EGW08_004823 [Elysia chlorotica]|uniref:guanylate cyclase n=1 Tax=Elysia chlorotica TaxID=188477 RepID=A0A433U132_ELYCH|nr:hypothetical protein EGW08_004823 [Elysia chlorotica]